MQILGPPPLNRSNEQFGPEPFRQAQGPERQAEGLTPKSPPTPERAAGCQGRGGLVFPAVSSGSLSPTRERVGVRGGRVCLIQMFLFFF